MAKKKASGKKAPMRPRTCRTFKTKHGMRKVCKMADGKVKFKKMSFKFK